MTRTFAIARKLTQNHECSKISNIFSLFLFTIKLWLSGLETANREDPDHTAFSKESDLDLHCLSRGRFGRQLVFEFFRTSFIFVCILRSIRFQISCLL